MIRLSINTSDSAVTRVTLKVHETLYQKESDSRVFKSQMTLPLIESLLLEANIRLSDISDIHVHEGPGSFTGVRVGISIANTLAFMLKVPLNGKVDLAKAKY